MERVGTIAELTGGSASSGKSDRWWACYGGDHPSGT